MMMAPIPSDTNIESLNKLLEILVINFSILLSAIIGVIIFLCRRWKKKLTEKDKENQQLKDKQIKLAELCNQICYFVDSIASETIRTEPSIVKWATWWSLNYHSLDTNGTTETQEMIKRIISRKEV